MLSVSGQAGVAQRQRLRTQWKCGENREKVKLRKGRRWETTQRYKAVRKAKGRYSFVGRLKALENIMEFSYQFILSCGLALRPRAPYSAHDWDA